MMTEAAYVRHVEIKKYDDLRLQLDWTPGREFLKLLRTCYSRISTAAGVTPKHRLSRRQTARPVMVKPRIVPGTGNFTKDGLWPRRVAFNTITLEEAWDRLDAASS